MEWRFTTEDVRRMTGADEVIGTCAVELTGIADLAEAEPGQISFLSSKKYLRHLGESRASVVLVPSGTAGEPPVGTAWLPLEDPSIGLARLCKAIEQHLVPPPVAGISEDARVAEGAQVDPSAHIGPFCIIESGARIGANVVLESSVRIGAGVEIGEGTRIQHGAWIGPRTRIGARCLLHAGAVLGADGFGFHSDASGHHKLPQIGIVVLEDDVEVGAHSCIDRARFGETRIGQGTKVDNLVQIGHNVRVGRHCILCAQVGIAGSARFGDFVVLGGQVGVNGHIEIGNGVQAAAKTGIAKSVPAGTILSGMPARPRNEDLRRLASIGSLPKLSARVSKIEKLLAQSEGGGA